MVTRHNGFELPKYSMPSGGLRGFNGKAIPEQTKEGQFYAKTYSALDAYLETEPGTEKAAKALARYRRA